MDILPRGDVVKIVESWITHFNSAIQSADSKQISRLFIDDSHWREVLSVSWFISTTSGNEQIGVGLANGVAQYKAHNFCIDTKRYPPRQIERAGVTAIEAILKFETAVGQGAALLRMRCDGPTPSPTQAWTFHTTLETIRGHEESTIRGQKAEPVFNRDFQGPNWLDKRQAASRFTDREPTVLIVGGGHAGLSVAARLGQIGVDALVVDRMNRVGDNWRLRYHGLMLHNQVHSNHLPYIPYPSTWQPYLPKDRIANFLEMYVDCMDIHFWTETTFAGAQYDDDSQTWQAQLQKANGQTRTVKPKHIIMATSVSGSPLIPTIPTIDQYKGPVMHSSQFGDGAKWTGKNVLVIGTGTSAHDIAQDLHGNGARTTMVQRSPTLVLNVEPTAQLYDGIYLGEGPSLEDRDLINTSIPLRLMLATHKRLTDQGKIHDKPILDGLEKVGFKLDYGVDGTGWPYLFRTRGGGYYFNVGCSDLIANGDIPILQNDNIATYTATGLQTKDGRQLSYDAIVLGTGYKGHTHLLQSLFGDKVAQSVGQVWGFDTQAQELKNMWTRTAQKGLWFTGGAFSQCRAYSKYLALQIKATELNLISS